MLIIPRKDVISHCLNGNLQVCIGILKYFNPIYLYLRAVSSPLANNCYGKFQSVIFLKSKYGLKCQNDCKSIMFTVGYMYLKWNSVEEFWRQIHCLISGTNEGKELGKKQKSTGMYWHFKKFQSNIFVFESCELTVGQYPDSTTHWPNGFVLSGYKLLWKFLVCDLPEIRIWIDMSVIL